MAASHLLAAPLSAAHRVPHTTKPPTRCPHCSSTRLIRKGTRRKKLEIAQLWQCKVCRRVFTPAPSELRYKSYPLRLILDGVTLYNLGYSLPGAVQKLKEKHGYKIAPNTLATWMVKHRDLTTYLRLRSRTPIRLKPAQIIRSTKLYHRQVYSFAYHRQKLALLRQDERHQRFAPLADFLSRLRASARIISSRKARAPRSSANSSIAITLSSLKRKITQLAQRRLLNRLRHETLQRFLLANDSVTLAVEIPIWLTGSDIEALEIEHGIDLHGKDKEPASLTGHIDFIQVRNGAVHILDYKPDARTNKPIAQLTLYALALTRLAGLQLFDIKCAWFNGEQYCEFFPRSLLARQ